MVGPVLGAEVQELVLGKVLVEAMQVVESEVQQQAVAVQEVVIEAQQQVAAAMQVVATREQQPAVAMQAFVQAVVAEGG